MQKWNNCNSNFVIVIWLKTRCACIILAHITSLQWFRPNAIKQASYFHYETQIQTNKIVNVNGIKIIIWIGLSGVWNPIRTNDSKSTPSLVCSLSCFGSKLLSAILSTPYSDGWTSYIKENLFFYNWKPVWYIGITAKSIEALLRIIFPPISLAVMLVCPTGFYRRFNTINSHVLLYG